MSNIVWSKMQCHFCDMAKRLLEQKEIVYEERMIGEGWTTEQLLEAVPNVRTVPQIVLDGKLIGNYDNLVEHFKKINKEKYARD